MAFQEIRGVRIAGMAAAVPKWEIRNTDYVDTEIGIQYNLRGFIESTGVKARRVSLTLTTSDLGFEAAEKLISDLKWEKDSIDALLFVSQTADYILPATACILQDRLGLSKGCYATDISLGCSGWVYGLSLAASLVSSGGGKSFRRVLLIAGDSKGRVMGDHPLFGAASTVTALEYKRTAKHMLFEFGTDGSGYDAIIIPDGGCRNGISEHSFEEYVYDDGHKYNRLQSRMNGIDVFSFGISTAPKSVKSLASHFGFDYLDSDYYVFHQANRAMNDKIVKKLKLDPAKVPYSIDRFGNTSSASIPITIVSRLQGLVEKEPKKFICCGFGVGLSWGSVAFESDGLLISDIVEVEEAKVPEAPEVSEETPLQDEMTQADTTPQIIINNDDAGQL